MFSDKRDQQYCENQLKQQQVRQSNSQGTSFSGGLVDINRRKVISPWAFIQISSFLKTKLALFFSNSIRMPMRYVGSLKWRSLMVSS